MNERRLLLIAFSQRNFEKREPGRQSGKPRQEHVSQLLWTRRVEEKDEGCGIDVHYCITFWA